MIDSADTVLPEPNFADQRHDLALGDAEGHAFDRLDRHAARAEPHRQVAHVDEGR